MSETARQVITTALRMIWVSGESEAISSYDMQLAIEILNGLMAAYEADGIDINFTAITGATDTVTIEDGLLLPLKRVLAYELWGLYYRDQIPQPVYDSMKEGKNQIYRFGRSGTEMSFPSTLPIGTGNWNVSSNSFYETEDDT